MHALSEAAKKYRERREIDFHDPAVYHSLKLMRSQLDLFERSLPESDPVLDIPIERLPLSKRIIKGLAQGQFQTLRDFVRSPMYKNRSRLVFVGKKYKSELDRFLAKLGY